MLSQLVAANTPYVSRWATEVSTQAKPEKKPTNYAFEIRLTKFLLICTLAAWLGISWHMGTLLWHRIHAGRVGASLEELVFIIIIQGLIYGNFVYQLTRLGYLRRRLLHKPLIAEAREALYETAAPTLAVLIPSYKEEVAVVRRTLLSAALQDYPHRRIVLLVDDPPVPNNPWDQKALEATRNLSKELQAVFDAAAKPFLQAEKLFAARTQQGRMDILAESEHLAELYEQAAAWLEIYAGNHPLQDHADDLLNDKIFKATALAHLTRARELRQDGSRWTSRRIQREYKRLAALFHVEFTSFERKRFTNLSHESNKAMNLNSYIRLLGRSWREVARADGLHLEEAPAHEATLSVPSADFLITLDADSMIVPEYALVLVNEMLKSENKRLAVAQTPYNTIPNAPGLLERIAGATTDAQYINHQGLTSYNATYWVGANALLRTEALSDIRHTISERGFEMPVFIHNRTVIEDTESTVDLIACGWRLYNYPERLAYSATPPDFGSLLIQRRRWANGGLIILPKLIRHLFSRPYSLSKMNAGFYQVHYLISLALINTGVFVSFIHSFEGCINRLWLFAVIAPWAILYARDLCYNGYRARDLLHVVAINIVLIPINMGGVLKSLEQAITGKRIPFGRTPKVSGRTAVPALYVFMEYALLFWMLGLAIYLAPLHPVSAAICLMNALAFTYGIACFIGVRESWEDLCAGLPKWLQRFGKENALLEPIHSFMEPARISVSQ